MTNSANSAIDPALLKNMIFASLFCALYVIGTLLRIPLGPVPIVLTNLFLVLGAWILGPLWGTLSVLLYLFLGLIGLPVFSTGGGIVVLRQPTAGFLAGYFLVPLIAGLARNLGKASFGSLLAGGALGMLAIYLPGIIRLQQVLDLSREQSLTVGFYPFLPGDAIKLAIALSIIQSLKAHKPGTLLNMPKK